MAGPEEPLGTFARELFAPIGSDYDRVAAVLSFGQDPRWRRALVRGMPVSPSAHVLDVATGTAAVAIALARRYGCRVTGLDQSAEMLATGRRARGAGRARRARSSSSRAARRRCRSTMGRSTASPSTYLLRYVDDVPAAVRELVRVARPGAPSATSTSACRRCPRRASRGRRYTRAGLPLAGRAIGHGWLEVGRFLNGSIRSFGEQLSAGAARRACSRTQVSATSGARG